MSQPNYVLQVNEMVLMKQPQGGAMDLIRKAVWIIVAVIIIGSIIFRKNLFSELSVTARVLLIGLLIFAVFGGGKTVEVPSPIELQFYDDYLLIYRPSRYYSRKVTRREYNRMAYDTINSCELRLGSKMLYFRGDVEAVWYRISADGTVSDTPEYQRLVKDTMQYMSIRCAENVDFKYEIEAHSPLKVTVIE